MDFCPECLEAIKFFATRKIPEAALKAAEPAKPKGRPGRKPGRKKIDAERAWQMYMQGVKVLDIAKEFDAQPSSIHTLLSKMRKERLDKTERLRRNTEKMKVKDLKGIIKVSTNLEVSTHTFPEGTLEEQRRQLCALIGNGCTMLEMVRPRRLYGNSVGELGCTLEVLEKGKSKAVGMLVDEEFLCRDNKPEINMVGSYLYETDKHGSPILGNVLFVGLAYGEDGGIDFTGIEEEIFKKLYEQLLTISINLKVFQNRS